MSKLLQGFSTALRGKATFFRCGKAGITKNTTSLLVVGSLLALATGNKVLAQYSPIAVTGYNADVVAHGTGSAIALTSNDVDGAGYIFKAVGYTNPANVSTTSGLPISGSITSAVGATPGLTYQLAPYDANNSLRLNGSSTGTLTFPTPTAAEKVYVLATSGSGTSTTTITVTFADNTTQVFTQTVADWYNGANFAITGLGRVNRNTNTIENSTTNPRLYQYELSIVAGNFSNPIQSITFANTGAVLNVMGISIKTPPANCAGTPTAGTTPATLTTCPGNTVTITATGATFASGISHQWQQSTDNGATWVNAVGGSGANSTSYTTPVITSTNSGIQYQLVTTCSFSSETEISNPTTVTNSSFLDCYCTSTATNSADTELLNVTFGTLNNTSTCSTTGGAGSTQNRYSNYKTTVAAPSVMQGDVVPFSVLVGTCSGNYNKAVKAFIDYNQNGLLTDAGEEVIFLSAPNTSTQTLSGSITIPFSAIPGNTLMRVVLRESGTAANITPCGTYTYGETEDYLVNITAAPACAGTPSAGTISVTSPVTAAHCASGTFTLEVLGSATGSSGLVRQWQMSTDGSNFTDIPGANGTTYTTPVITASGTTPVYTYYQFKITCTNSGLSEESTPEITTVNPNPVVTTTVDAPILCSGSSTAITANSSIAGTTFAWTASPDLSATTGNVVTATPTAPSVYEVTATTPDGCTATATANVMASAQFFNLPVTNNYTLVGNATAQAGDFYQLTPAVNTQTGAVWNNTPITLTSAFDFSFTVNQCGGADGMGFVLQNSGLNAIGEGGGSMGYYGTHPNFTQSLAVLQKIYLTSQLIVTKNKNATALSTTTISPTLSNCNDRVLRVTWDPATTEFKVYFDNVLRYTLTENIINTVFGGNPQVYFGFTGATGGVNAAQKFRADALLYTPTYTVNQNYADNLFNFSSFENLSQILSCVTLTAPVTIEVMAGSGPYTEPLVLGTVQGSSNTNTITLNGNGNAINFCSNTSGNRDIIRLDGTDNVTLTGFTLNATCNYGWGIHLMGDISNVTLTNNTINLDAAKSIFIANMQGIVATNSMVNPQVTGGHISGLVISGNTINQGYHAIRIDGQNTGPLSTGIVVSGNTINTPMAYGIDVRNAANPTLSGNLVTMRTGSGYLSNNSAGLVLVNTEDGLTVTQNRVINAGSMGAYLFNVNRQSTTRGMVANNMLGGGFQNTTIVHALQLNYASYLDVYHNSTLADNGAVGSGFYVSNQFSRFLNVMNNSFAYTGPGTGYAMQANNGNVNFLELNNNNYYSPGVKFVRYSGADRNTLVDLQSAPGVAGHDMQSMSSNPLYVSTTDLHLQSTSPLLGQANGTTGTGVDFDNDPRTSPTDIGADEYLVSVRVQGGKVAFGEAFPNPFHNQLTVKLNTNDAGAARVVVLDVLGKQVFQNTYSVHQGANELTVNLSSEMAQGVYLMQVTAADTTTTYRVVKQ